MLRDWASTTYFCQIIEAILTGIIFAIAFAAPRAGSRLFGRVERLAAQLARRPRQTTIGIVAAIIVARLCLLVLVPIPEPSIHDEFSYLLAAKTFAAGRLTNLPDPFWRHFESVHILQRPTYMSMYAPGQGLTLAAGLWTTGQAWFGVVVSVGLLGGALFWALSGWFPGRWALAASVLAAIRWLLLSYWMNSYWGGALPALGGALIFGSVPRLAQKANVRHALILAFGVILLANTRPFEGLVITATSLALLIAWSKRSGMLHHIYRLRLIAPVASVLALTAAAMLYYNARVTGDPFTLPYVEDRQEYAIAPLFIWGHLRPEPVYATQSLRAVYVAEADLYRTATSGFGIPEVFRKLKNFWIFFLGPLLSVPIVAFPFALERKNSAEEGRRARYVGAIPLIMLIAAAQVVWFYPHYFAPAFAPFVGTLLLGFRELRGWRWHGRESGLFLSRAIPIGCVLMATIPASAHQLGWRLNFWPLQWALGSSPEIQGPNIKSSILAGGRKALVFVEYGDKHDPGSEWVYNEPDIQNAQIVWARRVNPRSDAALMRRFRDRSFWVLRPDEHPAALIPLRPPEIRVGEISSSAIW